MTNYAIIGDGAVGTTAAFYIRRHDPAGRITIYSDEPTPAYYRAALTNYLMGELTAQQLFAVPPDFYQQFRVERVHMRVTAVDAERRRLTLSSGDNQSFDKLLIGAGAHSRMPEFPGVELGGVKVLRTMQDARYVMDGIQSGRLRHAVVVGGGILGLEWVAGLRTRRVGVSYVIRGNEFMPNLLDQAASDLVKSRMRHYGVDLRTHEELDDVFGDADGFLQAVRLKNSGDVVEAQMLGFAIGIVPNIEFLEGSGIEVTHGIPVDHHMRTNVDGIYAGGDIAMVEDPVSGATRGLGLWEPARHHGRTAGINMAGGTASWRLEAQYNATRLYDLDLAAVGETKKKPGDEVLVEFPEAGAGISYKKLVLRDDKLVGAILLGLRKERARGRGRALHKLIALGADCSAVKDDLLDPLFDVSRFIDSLKAQGVERAAVRKTGAVGTDVSRIMERPKIFGAPESVSTRSGRSVERAAPKSERSLSTLMSRAEGGVVVSSGGSEPPEGGGLPEGSNGSDPSRVVTSREAAAVLRLEDGTLKTLGEAVTIGRSPDNGLVLDDPQASGRHAEIRRGADGQVIADLESSNGLFVDEVRVITPVTLHDGQIIRLGQTRLTYSRQVTTPRAETGPAGLPDEPLRPTAGETFFGRLSWPGGSYDLASPQAQIGRDPSDSDVHVDDPAVSWLHAEVGYHDGGCYVRDLGSRNGTYVNGSLVTVPHLLRDGDVIHCGTTDFSFDTSAASRPATEKTPAAGPAEERDFGARLLASSGPLLGLSFALGDRAVMVGRDESTTIALKDLTVSRQHVAFRPDGRRWTVVDQASTNGTFVNGERLEANRPLALNHGDQIKIGDTVFAYESGAEETKSPRAATQVGIPAVPPPRPPVSVMVLIASAGPLAGTRWTLDELPLTFGRVDAPGIIGLNDHFISSRHLRVDRSGSAFAITDLGSTNGTQVGDTPLAPNAPHQLEAGDRIQLGPRTVIDVSEETSR